MVNVIKDENYEEVRAVYDGDLARNFNPLKLKHLAKVKSLLKNSGLVSLSDKEAVRLGLYLDDMHQDKEFFENFNFSNWISANMERNPEFFSKFFRPAMTEQQLQEKEPVNTTATADIDKEVPFEIEVEDEMIKSLASLPRGPEKQIEHKHTELKLSEPIPSQAFSDDSILEAAAEVEKLQQIMLERKLREMLSTLKGIDLTSKSSVMAAIAQSGAYKSLITTMLALLKVKVNTTSFENGVSSKTIEFDPEREYSIEELRQGAMQAKLTIAKMHEENEDLDATKVTLRQAESRIVTISRSLSEATDRLSNLLIEFNNEKTKPKVADAKLLYCYFAWDERVEGQLVTYYLTTLPGTQASEKTGVYPVMSLRKTTDYKKAVKFKSKELAILQKATANKFWQKIDVKSKISVNEHLNKGYMVEYTKNKTPF